VLTRSKISTANLPIHRRTQKQQRRLAMQNPRLAEVNVANLVNLTLMRKLEDSGYFSQLQNRYGQ